jgi:hypothetical protein
MTLRQFVLLLFVSSLAVPAFAATIAQPGRWETTVQTEMANMPMKIPARTVTTCVTKEQAENGEKLVPKPGDNRGGCTYDSVKVDGNTISWKVTCEKSGLTGTGSLTYHGDSFDGSMHMKMQDREVTVTYNGKRVGECDGTEMK